MSEKPEVTVISAAPVVPWKPMGLRSRKERRNPGSVTGYEWDPWIEELYFMLWVDAGRNMVAAKKTAPDKWAEFTDQPYADVPLPTLYFWCRSHDWPTHATIHMAQNYHPIFMNAQALQVQAGADGAQLILDVIRGQYDHIEPRLLDIRLKAAMHSVQGLGLGTYGTRDRVSQPVKVVVQTTDARDLATMTLHELDQLELELTHRSHTGPDERRHR